MAKKKKTDEEVEEQSKGGGKSKIIMIVAALVAVAALGKFGILPIPGLAPKAAKAEEPKKVEPTPGLVVDAGSMTVNLADGKGYARVGFGVVLDAAAGEHGAEEVTNHLPILKDAAIAEIGKYTAHKLLHPKGKEHLKEALTHEAHELFHEAALEVVLTEFIVQ